MLPWIVRELATDSIVGTTRLHDTVMYRILRGEWRDVRRRIDGRLARHVG